VDDLAVGFAVLVEKVGNDLSTCCGVCYSKSAGCLILGVSHATGREGARNVKCSPIHRSAYIEHVIVGAQRSCLLDYVERETGKSNSYGMILTYSFCASMMRRQESLVEAVEAGMPRRSRKDEGAIVFASYNGLVLMRIVQVKCVVNVFLRSWI
jgi:hypothetical protein